MQVPNEDIKCVIHGIAMYSYCMHARIEHKAQQCSSGLTTEAVQGTISERRRFSRMLRMSWSDLDLLNLAILHSTLSTNCSSLTIDHNYLKASRIGEAANPGPESYIDLCLINPTAIAHKKELLCSLNADILSIAETSATSMLQSEFNQAIKETPYTMYWGLPVEDKVKVSTLRDNKPSRRGEALRTAIMTRVLSRRSRIEGDSLLRQSCRFVPCRCYLGEIELLVIAAYFFPGRTLYAQYRMKSFCPIITIMSRSVIYLS